MDAKVMVMVMVMVSRKRGKGLVRRQVTCAAGLVVVAVAVLRQIYVGVQQVEQPYKYSHQHADLPLLQREHVQVRVRVVNKNKHTSSMVQCVGENFLPKTATGFRSCQFRHLCFDFDSDTNLPDFVLFESPQQQRLAHLLQQLPSRYVQTSSSFNVTVSLAATTEGLLRQGHGLGWFPRVLVLADADADADADGSPPANYSYQQLDDDVVMVPAQFPHDDATTFKDILLDLFLPVYNLLAMFDLQHKKLLLVNLNLGNCTSTASKTCFQKTIQLLPLMNLQYASDNANIQDNPQQEKPWGDYYSSSKILQGTRDATITMTCAKFGAAGMGALTDHGIHKKSHGQHKKDYLFVHNNGRGPLFLDFRNYVLRNLGLLPPNHNDKNGQESSWSSKKDQELPLQISVMVTSKKSQSSLHAAIINVIQKSAFGSHQQVQVHLRDTSQMSLTQQTQIALHTHIYLIQMGSEAWPAMFLPPGATLILLYDDHDTLVNGASNNINNNKRRQDPVFPVRLDWDFWNNLSYLRVHWLPRNLPSTSTVFNQTLPTEDAHHHHKLVLEIIQDEISRLLPPDSTSQQQQKSTTRESSADDPAGTFNGMKVRLVNRTQASTVHCVGDNFQEGAHVYRSCHFQYLCFNVDSHNFSLHMGPSSLQQRHINNNNHNSNNKTSVALISTASTNMAMSVGRTIRFSGDMSWSPDISREPLGIFYELAHDAVWVPFYAEQPNIHNPGHLLWDYFLPFYNLLVMFGLQHLPMVPINLNDGCTPDEQDSPCWKLVTKFLALVGVEPSTFTNTHQSTLTTTQGRPRQSNLVCARHAVAGIGMLTDHGWNRHGQRMEDYRDVHNVGRGPLFFEFRNYVLGNLGIVEQEPLKPPYKVVFSALSSKNPIRRQSFQNQMDALRGAFSDKDLIVENHVFSTLNVKEQIQLATETAVFVSVVGGSASVATFLPRGSSVILFFNDVNEFTDHSSRKDFPSMIDWDFWNSAAHLRVHWMPMKSMNETVNHNALVELVKSELSTIQDML
jgi:hypothetical protein